MKESADDLEVKNDSKIFSLSICKLKLSCIEMKTIQQKVWGVGRIGSFVFWLSYVYLRSLFRISNGDVEQADAMSLEFKGELGLESSTHRVDLNLKP